ncbi:MAG: hypothetical protein HY912_01735 [Desulfomonile tiedjei]|uniref:Uncharacterized protein n=1 Tax=Desulfomonile tiedjei TaxID=2358 RepID=A0A9D6Z1Y6_9BACT|nr:hypothetical protein [Desulfomonile tiedjei]
MSKSKQAKTGLIHKRQKGKKEDTPEAPVPSTSISEEATRQKLKKLDEFMEGVLQKAGPEFLDEFKQVEGE